MTRLLILSFFCSGCSFLPGDTTHVPGDATPITITSKTITLQWDPPPGSPPFGPLSVSFYRVYYRDHGSANWAYWAQVPSSEDPQCVLKHSDFGDGRYDFAVAAVDTLGAESPLHGSLDTSAFPFGGWYVIWNSTADK